MIKIVCFLGLLAIANALVSYKNYKVYNIVPKTEAEVQILTDLKKEGYQFWTDIFKVDNNVRIMVAPTEDEEFEKYIKSVKLEAVVSIANVQDLIDAQHKTFSANSTRSSSLGSHTWDRYWSLDHIYNWLDELESLYPDVVTTITIGNTFEGRPIKGVIIDFKSNGRGERPFSGMIEGGIHAREWISPATVTWIIKEFLTSSDPAVRAMAESFIWHIFPVTNPDSYVYSFTNDRMWRKNRNTANRVPCEDGNDDLGNGVDLNRNFDFLWATDPWGSHDPCNLVYPGLQAASELETQAIANHVLRLQQSTELVYYLSFHSSGQWILIPYAHVASDDVLEVPNYSDLFEVAIRGADKLEARHGSAYIVATLKEILGIVAMSGSSVDWVKGVADVPIVYLFELRDTEFYGFLLPPEQIIPNNEEIMDALVEMNRVTKQLGYYYTGAGTVLNAVLSLVVALGMLAVFQ